MSRNRIRLVAWLSVALFLGCLDAGSSPTAPADTGLQLKPDRDCEVADPHPSCKNGDDGSGSGKVKGGYYIPADFPDLLAGGGANGMIADPHDQTIKTGSGNKFFANGFNPDYRVAMNLAVTYKAGIGPCSVDPTKDPGNWSDARLATLLGKATEPRYTIVRVGFNIDQSDPVHELETHGSEATVRIEDSPTVMFTPGRAGGNSGTYQFSGGTLRIADHAGGIYSILYCPNLDVVEVVLDFSGI